MFATEIRNPKQIDDSGSSYAPCLNDSICKAKSISSVFQVLQKKNNLLEMGQAIQLTLCN